ncbi:DNA polymerase-4 [Antricoccus suffuscus]|uniref:DNA polymerase-4 n=1 Tax=Antricoccus suffuscus TaxID=1629062 RepID=A0A2T0ZVM7_9ACTN|nr:DNA polymerase IV [Antricoccus suffuscus]PRZ40416.1 DNA polymerase-4 [Antricoccus suffuscus]
MTEDAPQMQAWILHVDLDQYVAAVEIRRRPELRGLPVVVGGSGDPTQARQVVATASYEAREYGVHSGMPLRAAYRKCPEAVFLAADHSAYDAASEEVMDTLRSFELPVEVWGWDEAFVGATTDDPVGLANDIRARVLERTELSCAVGIGDTKERAKMATGFAKPGGVYQLTAANWMPIMGERQTRELWGIGTRTAAKLAAHDLKTVAELASADPRALAQWFGPTIGPNLTQLAKGGFDTRIETEPRVAKSTSKQTTFPVDLTERDDIEAHVTEIASEVAAEAFRDGRVATHVGVTVRTASFFTRTKTGKLPAPTTDPEDVRRGALRVLERFDLDRPVRLLGVRVVLEEPT